MNNIINLKSLPKDLLNKIPLSIRVKKDNIDFDDLPVEVAYELKHYQSKIIETQHNETVYDVVPKISIYNDFELLTTKKNVVLEYVKNYMSLRKGTYPYDPSVGNEFYKYLQLLDRSVVDLMIKNEFIELQRIVFSIFNRSIELLEYSIKKNSVGIHVEYDMLIKVKVDETTHDLLVNI